MKHMNPPSWQRWMGIDPRVRGRVLEVLWDLKKGRKLSLTILAEQGT